MRVLLPAPPMPPPLLVEERGTRGAKLSRRSPNMSGRLRVSVRWAWRCGVGGGLEEGDEGCGRGLSRFLVDDAGSGFVAMALAARSREVVVIDARDRA